MTAKRFLPPLLALVLLMSVVPGTASSKNLASGPLAKVVCSIPHAWLLRIWIGYRADRSAEIQILP